MLVKYYLRNGYLNGSAGSKHTFSHTARLSSFHFHMFICRNLVKWLHSPAMIYVLLKKPNHPLPTTVLLSFLTFLLKHLLTNKLDL